MSRNLSFSLAGLLFAICVFGNTQFFRSTGARRAPQSGSLMSPIKRESMFTMV